MKVNNVIGIIFLTLLLSLYIYATEIIGLLILVAIVVLALIILYFTQNLFLYIPITPNNKKSPSRNPFGLRHPSQHNLRSSDLCLSTSDGVLIKGWHIKAQFSKRILIYFHQNAGNIGTRLYFIRNLVQRTHSDVIIVAFRGYSDSQSSPSEEGIMKDSLAIMQYALSYSQSHQNTPIYILGRSLGGAVAIFIGIQQRYKHKIRGIILENTFTSISDMIDYHLPYLNALKFLQRNFWPSIDRIALVKAPLLFVKCLKDDIVPYQQMDQLINRATTVISQFIIQEGTHNTSWIILPNKYFSKIIQFFQINQK